MNISSKLYFVELISKMYKNLLFIFTYIFIDTYKLRLSNMNIIMRKAIWCYTYHQYYNFQLIMQTSNTGSCNWFLYIHPEDQCPILDNKRCSKSKTKEDIKFKRNTNFERVFTTHDTILMYRVCTTFFTTYFVLFYYIAVHIFASKHWNIPAKSGNTLRILIILFSEK